MTAIDTNADPCVAEVEVETGMLMLIDPGALPVDVLRSALAPRCGCRAAGVLLRAPHGGGIADVLAVEHGDVIVTNPTMFFESDETDRWTAASPEDIERVLYIMGENTADDDEDDDETALDEAALDEVFTADGEGDSRQYTKV